MAFDIKGAVLDLVPETDPILFRPCDRFDLDNPPLDPVKLADDLKASLISYRGYGLSANQVGIPWRVFAFGDVTNVDSLQCVFNPTIVWASEETDTMEEGCLSFPDLILAIKRPKEIRVRMTNEFGQTVTKKFGGLTARIIQHEIDHLDGITFKRRATRYHLNKGERMQKKIRRSR